MNLRQNMHRWAGAMVILLAGCSQDDDIVSNESRPRTEASSATVQSDVSPVETDAESVMTGPAAVAIAPESTAVDVTPTSVSAPAEAPPVTATLPIPQPALTSAPTQPPGPAVTLIPFGVSATCQAADEADGRPVPFSPINVFDGRPATAWRCDAPAIGQRIDIQLSVPTRLVSVGLIPGYDKVDPTSDVDRFWENYRVRTVRWWFDDGSSTVQSFADDRELQTVAVAVVTSSVSIEIIDVYDSDYPIGNPHRREFVPISEVELLGSPA